MSGRSFRGLLYTFSILIISVFSIQGFALKETVDSPASFVSGSVTGIVKFDKAFPKSKRIRVSKDNEVCGNIKRGKSFIVDKESKGLKNVLITIEGVSGGKASSPTGAITIEQSGCDYSPHFQVAEIGDDGLKLTVLNKDGILHNIHSYLGKETIFNIAQPKFRKKLSRTLTEPGVVKFKCDVHDWMEAYVIILKDQPYYAVTDEKGAFSIEGVPPGTYTLKAWHEALGNMEKSVEITDRTLSEVDFVIRPKGKRSK